MEPVSEKQFQATTGGGVPDPEPIDDGLWSVPMPMPSGSLAYTLSAVHVDAAGAVTVLDPGWHSDAAMDRLDAFLSTLGRAIRDIVSIVVTHGHPDHIGLAGALRAASGAALFLSGAERDSLAAAAPADPAARLAGWGVPPAIATGLAERMAARDRRPVPPVPPDVVLEDGDRIPVGDAGWRALSTPGHTPGHVCVVDEERRVLFSGDHVLPAQFPGLGLGAVGHGDPVADYLRSLERLRPYDGFEVSPGHGYRFRGLGARREATTAHVLRRAREVAAIVGAEPAASTWEVASRLTWTSGWERLSESLAVFSALHQTDLYRAFAARTDGSDVEVR